MFSYSVNITLKYLTNMFLSLEYDQQINSPKTRLDYKSEWEKNPFGKH